MTQFTPTEVQQQVFTLSWFSNVAVTEKLSQASLQAQLQDLKTNIGAWNVVWGPQNTPSDGSNIVNSMFVAQAADAAQPTFVVAIAGTNPKSQFDWLTEDLDITPTGWKYGLGAGQVTTGDYTGLINLLAMTDEGQTLQEFLAGIPDKSNTSLTFTGLSLGGALAPMLTLALMDPASSLNTTNDISIGKWGEVSLLALAGPSIGDATFVQYFNSALSAASCAFIWNAIDIVPHAWNKVTMMELTSPTNIYNLPLVSSSCLAVQIAQKQTNAAACNYTQFEQIPAFSGALEPYTPSSSVLWTPGSQFLAQAVYQHTNAYVIAFNCTWLQPQNVCAEPVVAVSLLAAVDSLCPPNPTP
jgi:hypothetical protein